MNEDFNENIKSKNNFLADWYNSLSKNARIISNVILWVLALDAFGALFFAVTKHHSSLRLDSVLIQESKRLYAVNSSAKNALVKSGDVAYFAFSDEQMEYFLQTSKKYGSSALTLRLFVPQDNSNYDLKNLDLKFGFLDETDFNKHGKFIKQKYSDKQRVAVNANLASSPESFDLSLSLNKNGSVPYGFFVSSVKKVKILQACVTPAMVGFDLGAITAAIPYYGFSPNGGNVDFLGKSFDFSGSQNVFLECEYTLTLTKVPETLSTAESSIKTTLNFNGEKYSVKNVKQSQKLVIPPMALKTAYGRVELNRPERLITSLLLKDSEIKTQKKDNFVLTPISTDPGLMLNYKKANWRCGTYELFSWDRFPGILFFDTLNYDVQSRFFTRLAYFVEKKGFRGKLLTNEQLEGMHGYNAHDYSAASMAEFFNKATIENFDLNEEELLLKQILLTNGLLIEDGPLVKANEGGLVSISQESAMWLRHTFLAHEGWHTIFFNNEDFRNFVGAVYYTIDPSCLQFLLDYFESQDALGYDPEDDYLIHNEFMAYIMQQPISEVAKYFVHLANRGSVINYTPQLASYIRTTQARGFEDAAVMLNDYVFDNFGIVCGNIALVNKIN